jgi:hypothetical protein
MSTQTCRELLGDEVIAHIDAVVDAAPEPTAEVVEALRRIFTRPGGAAPQPFRVADAA